MVKLYTVLLYDRRKFGDQTLEDEADRLRLRGELEITLAGESPKMRPLHLVKVTARGLEVVFQVTDEESVQLNPSLPRRSAFFSMGSEPKLRGQNDTIIQLDDEQGTDK